MESYIYNNVNWRDEVYNAKKALEQIIIDAKNMSQEKIDEMFKKDDKELSSILTLKKYEPRTVDVIVWPLYNEHKIMFKFLNDNFQWNIYENEFTNKTYYKCLEEIGNTIIKEFSILYNHINFVSYLESMRYWVNKHSYIFSI